MKIIEKFNSSKNKTILKGKDNSLVLRGYGYYDDNGDWFDCDYISIINSSGEKIMSGRFKGGVPDDVIKKMELIIDNVVKVDDYLKKFNSFIMDKKARVAPSNKYRNNGNKYKNNSGGKTFKGSGSREQIPIFMLIELLADKGYIDVVGDLEKNGKEVKYRFVIGEKIPTRKLKDNFIVSVVGQDNYEDMIESSMFYVDFKGYFKSSKGSAGEINFLKDLERYGAFGEPVVLPDSPSEEDISIYEKNVYKKVINILNDLRSDLGKDVKLVKSSGNGFGLKFSAPDMMPVRVQRKTSLNSIKTFEDILLMRGFSKEIIDEAFNDGVMLYGKTLVKKNGMQPINLVFPMYNIFDSKYPVGYEYCVPEYVSRGDSPKKFSKIFASIKRSGNTEKNIDGGSYFALSYSPAKKSKVKGTVFAEAVLDSLAVKQLMGYAGLDRDAYNHVAVQGVGNVINFLKENFGFYYQKMDDHSGNQYNLGDVFSYDRKMEYIDVPDEYKRRLKEKIEVCSVKFINDTSKKGSEFQLKKIKSFISWLGIDESNIEVIDVKYRAEKINNELLTGDNVIVLDNSNVDGFMEQNKIKLESGNYRYIQVSVSEERVNDKERLKYFGDKLKRVFGSDEIILAFDNDLAGLSYCEGFYKMCEKIGIKCRIAVPPFHVYKSDSGAKKLINDNNDILDFVNKYMERDQSSRQKIISWLTNSYFSQFSTDVTMSAGRFRSVLELASKIKEVESAMGDDKELMMEAIERLTLSEKKQKTGRSP